MFKYLMLTATVLCSAPAFAQTQPQQQNIGQEKTSHNTTRSNQSSGIATPTPDLNIHLCGEKRRNDCNGFRSDGDTGADQYGGKAATTKELTTNK